MRVEFTRRSDVDVLRHSRAGHAHVDYRIEGGFIGLRVTNDGAEDRPTALEGAVRGTPGRPCCAGP